MITDRERELAGELSAQLRQHANNNEQKWSYYEGRSGVKNMGIAIPEPMFDVKAVMGWPEIVVDALAERVEWLGWRSSEDIEGLETVVRQNQLDVEVSKAVLDSLVTGVGFLAATAGGEGEPEVIVTAVPSSQATYTWDARLNRMASGLVVSHGPDGELYETLYLPDVTISRVAARDGTESVTRDEHYRGRCSLIALPNRARSSAQAQGKSEISSTIRYYTDHGIRTVLGMEYNREIYTTPHRYLLNVTPEQIGMSEEPTQSELVRAGWQVAQNKALFLPPGDPDEGISDPQVGQFTAAPPTPYIDELRMLAQLVSAQSGVPTSYLGFVSDNPTSADAIRASEARLVKKAELRQTSFGRALVNDLAFVCQAILDGGPPSVEFMTGLSCVWREASTPTLAATVDAWIKLVQAGVASGSSEVLLDKLGLTEAEKAVIRRERAEDRALARLEALVAKARSPESPEVDPDVGLDEFVSGGDSTGL